VAAHEEFVKVEELASLAFPTHPHVLSRVEDTMAMEKEKGARFWRSILRIEFIN
jgi:hypothetical protein